VTLVNIKSAEHLVYSCGKQEMHATFLLRNLVQRDLLEDQNRRRRIKLTLILDRQTDCEDGTGMG